MRYRCLYYISFTLAIMFIPVNISYIISFYFVCTFSHSNSNIPGLEIARPGKESFWRLRAAMPAGGGGIMVVNNWGNKIKERGVQERENWKFMKQKSPKSTPYFCLFGISIIPFVIVLHQNFLRFPPPPSKRLVWTLFFLLLSRLVCC